MEKIAGGIMDQVLEGMEGVICYINEKDAESHLTNLEEVLSRLQTYNLRVKVCIHAEQRFILRTCH